MARQEEQSEEKSTKAKGHKNVLVIALVAVMSSAIIGGGLFFGLKSHNPAVAEAGNDKKSEHGKKKEAPVIYPLEAFIVNIGDGHDMRYLKVKIEFETTLTAEKVKLEMDPYLSPLRDSILVLLTTKTIQDVQDLPGKNRLREEIMTAANKVVPAKLVSSVYFTDFVVQ